MPGGVGGAHSAMGAPYPDHHYPRGYKGDWTFLLSAKAHVHGPAQLMLEKAALKDAPPLGAE